MQAELILAASALSWAVGLAAKAMDWMKKERIRAEAKANLDFTNISRMIVTERPRGWVSNEPVALLSTPLS